MTESQFESMLAASEQHQRPPHIAALFVEAVTEGWRKNLPSTARDVAIETARAMFRHEELLEAFDGELPLLRVIHRRGSNGLDIDEAMSKREVYWTRVRDSFDAMGDAEPRHPARSAPGAATHQRIIDALLRGETLGLEEQAAIERDGA